MNAEFLLMRGVRHALAVLMLLSMALVCCGCNEHTRQVEKGVLDLRTWDAERDGPVALNGFWDFSWEALLGPDMRYADGPVLGSQVRVPGAWNRSPGFGKLLARRGCATYRLTILLPEGTPSLSLLTGQISAAALVYANDELLFSRGRPGFTSGQETPGFGAGVVNIPLAQGVRELKLIALVSNFVFLDGGIKNSLLLGTRRDVDHIWFYQVLVYGGISAICFMAGLFCLGRFAMAHFRRAWLLSGIGCLLLALIAINSGPRVMMLFVPGLGFRVNLGLQLIPWLFCLPVAAGVLQTIYPLQASRVFLKFLGLLSVLGAFIVLLAPFAWIGFLFNPLVFITVLGGCYAVYVLIRALRAKRRGMEQIA